MRVLITTAAMILATIAFSPTAGIAGGKGGSGSGGGSGGSGGSGVHLGLGLGGGYWNSGHNWYPGYGYQGYNYRYYTPPYVVQSPILVNPLPSFSGGVIKIDNPATNNTALSYTLNGVPYTIQPGQSQQFVEDRDWVIDFSRGGNFGPARYGLHSGLYTFSVTDHGWELYNAPFVAAPGISGAPTNPLPPSPMSPSVGPPQ